MYIISTHISVRRRTKTLFLHSRIKKYFNSRLREETNRMISFALCHICHFNSRLRKETNHDACLFLYCHLRFQFTSPCGNERILIVWSNVPENFNSRLLGETNGGCRPGRSLGKKFQLTSPSGDEREVYSSELVIYIFQLTSPSGDEHYVQCIRGIE